MNGLTSCLQPLPHQPPSLNLLPLCPFKSVHQLCMARALQISVCVCVCFFCACGILCHDDPRHFTLFTDSKLRHKQNNSIKLSLFPLFYWGVTHPQNNFHFLPYLLANIDKGLMGSNIDSGQHANCQAIRIKI